jgi:hypothetical protein
LLLTYGSEHIMTPFLDVTTPNETPRPAKKQKSFA